MRLELKLGSQFLRERAGKPWYLLKPEDLSRLWREYFMKMIGDAELKDECDVEKRIRDAAEKLLPKWNKSRTQPIKSGESRAKSAYGCWLLIKSVGWERAKDSYTKTSWYRHLEILREAGLGDSDIAAGNVVSLRRRVIECQLIESWESLKQVA